MATLKDPQFCGFQLLGDSMLLRFSESLLGYHTEVSETGARTLGLCGSGTVIKELLRKVMKQPPTLRKVIILIGTNDLQMNKKLYSMKKRMQKLVKVLREITDLITILTVPPIPRLARTQTSDHWDKLDKYNTFLKSLDDGKTVRVVDIAPLFLLAPNQVNTRLFESFVGCPSNRRPDMVQWNKEGMVRVLDFLREQSWIDGEDPLSPDMRAQLLNNSSHSLHSLS